VTPTPDERFFFIHVMKTAGTTFARFMRRNFERSVVYPGPKDTDRHYAYYHVDRLCGISAGRMERLRVINGHFPYVASELVPGPFTRITILRDPIERTISHLKHAKREREHLADATLDEVYEDPFLFPTVLHNYQAKVFAFTAEDDVTTSLAVLDVDDERLKIAKSHLDRIDLLGLQERLPEFMEHVERRYGWSREDVPRANVSTEDWTVSPALRRRIIEDNTADQEFYEYGRELYRERQGSNAC
jgi:hypothetical protein